MTVARVATDVAAGRTFDYEVPPELSGAVAPGALVRVPFGPRTIEGVVLGLSDASEWKGGPLRKVLGIAPGDPPLTPALVELAGWMSRYYMAPVELCVKTMLPPVVRDGVDGDSFTRALVVRAAPGAAAVASATARQKEILERLGSGEELMAGFCRAWRVSPATLRSMQSQGLLEIERKVRRRDPLQGRAIAPSSPLPLTSEQRVALDAVVAALDEAAEAGAPPPRPVLLRGVTASGKTEVYLQAMAEVLARGGGAIVLVPEISLTPQTIRRFVSRFGSVVAVIHSRLSAGERHDEWHRIRSGEARVVVGPRSALFAPVRDLGLIVVDEEHEQSYKQDETPRYNARDVAVVRGRLEKCAVLLGSATPSLESWYNAETGKYSLCEMTRRALDVEMPRVTVVDMREEALRCGGPVPVFSETLVSAVRDRLRDGEQTMLLLNRRGFAPVVSCEECGHVETCENCSIGMTLHSADGVLRCHVCGAWRPVPSACAECGSRHLHRGGVGTQRVEQVAGRLFPGARIARMDLDVTTRKRSHEEILADFRAGRTDILVGTQMIAKGLDFPNVTLAGVLAADSALCIPDFRASERTFQLLAQMAGRSGRGVKPGDVVIQTFSPGHPAVECARTEDFRRFAECELRERRQLRYPPFSHLDCVTVKGADRTRTEEYAVRFAAAVGKSAEWRLGAPVPAAVERAKGLWRFQLVLRGTRPALLNSRLGAALAACPPPGGVSVAMDIDAAGAL